MSLLEAQWESEISSLKATQREDYQEFIVSDFTEKFQRDIQHEAKMGEENFQESSPGPKVNQGELSETEDKSSFSSPISQSEPQRERAESHSSSPHKKMSPEVAQKVKEICEMGFEENMAQCALTITKYNLVFFRHGLFFPLSLSLFLLGP